MKPHASCFLLVVSRLVLHLVLGSNYSAETTRSQWGVIKLHYLRRSTGVHIKPTKLLSSVARYLFPGVQPQLWRGSMSRAADLGLQRQIPNTTAPGIETKMCLPLLWTGRETLCWMCREFGLMQNLSPWTGNKCADVYTHKNYVQDTHMPVGTLLGIGTFF